ncbi:hypothetical protein HSR121_2412 [Halapricum desulfuricans]|uniref:Uncharacterized protein n=1 Tax=Halapricum desulfuricans TaxID=2841257 RepID=A0A897N696_9EURY|nr:hypothetical protein HSR121_2412 [Halapricum desulfuricans]
MGVRRIDSTPAVRPEATSEPDHVTSTGLEENVAAALAYALGWVSASCR